jgi:hypothetical protein
VTRALSSEWQFSRNVEKHRHLPGMLSYFGKGLEIQSVREWMQKSRMLPGALALLGTGDWVA